ncbi:hypothetical protein PG996_008153 [Apiospora saccharicola]|uniref:Rhodopsin domain-containing protein n=1 Tax=Apiospora saccharicola TaxID=335842 RepID=A0ABR1UZM2_9PEZI
MINIIKAQILDYISSALCLAILITRIYLEHLSLKARRRRRRRNVNYKLSIYLISFSAIAVVSRTVVTHLYLQLGAASPPPQPIDNSYIVGKILVLVARVLFTLVLWLQISLMLTFYDLLVHDVKVVDWVLRVIWGLVVATLIGVVLATFLECQPFSWYWDGDHFCQRGYIQLAMQTRCNILLDVVVLIVAFPLTRLSKHTWPQKLRVYALVGLGVLCIAISITRLVQTFKDPGQYSRTIWASIQTLVAVFISNAPTIYGSINTT